MNSKLCKRVSRHTEVILLEWLRGLVPDEEKANVTPSNLASLLPPTDYFYVNRQIWMSFYSPRWVRQSIKKLVRLGYIVENVTMKDLETFVRKAESQNQDEE